MISAMHFNEFPGSRPAHREASAGIHWYAGRDFGMLVLGFILCILVILSFSWYRGGFGLGGIRLITSLFDPRRSGPVIETPYYPPTGYGTPIPTYGGGYTTQPGGVYTAPPAGSYALRVAAQNLNLRRCPGFECEPITSLPYGMPVTLLGGSEIAYGQEWVRVRAGSMEGWVSRYYLE